MIRLNDCIEWLKWEIGGHKTAVATVAVTGFASITYKYFLKQTITDAIWWFFAWDSRPSCEKPLRPGRSLKVGILGNGIEGSIVALWLRDALGDNQNLDITVICDSPENDCRQTVEFEGQKYEADVSIISETNLYSQAIMNRFSLRERPLGLHLPFGVFNGCSFVFSSISTAALCGCQSVAKVLISWRLAWRVGFCNFVKSVMRLTREKASIKSKIKTLYRALREGATFAHPRELLSNLGHNYLQLSERPMEQWLVREIGLPYSLVHKLVEPGMRCNYAGQGCADLHGFAGLVGICLGFCSRCFSMCGGSELVQQRALEAAQPRILNGTARIIRRSASSAPHEPSFEVGYDASAYSEMTPNSRSSKSPRCKTAPGLVEGLLVESFHLVVIAYPFEQSKLQFEGCCETVMVENAPANSPAPVRSYIAHFVRGTLNLQSFCSTDVEITAKSNLNLTSGMRNGMGTQPLQCSGLNEEEPPGVMPSFTPTQVWTTADSKLPFYSITLELPLSLKTAKEVQEMTVSAECGEPQVYKITAPRQLSEHEIDKWFLRCKNSPICVMDCTCPQFNVPQTFRPFVFDTAGVYYVNAIDHLSSAMELSLIGARNVVNLITDWVKQRRGPCGF